MTYAKLALAILAASALPALPASASRIVPAQPSAFERVNLRLTTDSCAFVPASVSVRAEGNTIKVTQQLNQCFQAGTPGLADVQLGVLPPGQYRVEVYASTRTDVAPAETLSFTVTELAQIAIFPPPPRPLTNYTGMWWNPQESGWGLSINHGFANGVFGALFVYGANGQPEWYTLQGGQWTSSTRWTGQVYRTTGPYFAGPDFDPRLVLVQSAGTATLDFTQETGAEDRARFTYTVNGATFNKVITRMSF
jgi:hypothetical protein